MPEERRRNDQSENTDRSKNRSGHSDRGNREGWDNNRSENGVNREGFFSATKTFIEKIAYSLAMVVVSSVLAIGAPVGESVGMLGVKLTGVFAGIFSLLSLVCFIFYNEKNVTEFIAEHRKDGVAI